MNITTYKTLIRRELWEHKGSLIWVPAGLAAFILILAIIVVLKGSSSIQGRDNMVSFDFGETTSVAVALQQLAEQPIAKRVDAHRKVYGVSKIIFDSVVFLLALYYLLNCLYDERKDRSIYFWRSMPISDWQSVLSKLLTAVVVLPLVTLASLLALHVALRLLLTVAIWAFGGSAWPILWEPSAFLVLGIPMELVNYLLAFMWAAPLIGFLMVLGASTNKPMLFMFIIPAAIVLAEEILFDSKVFGQWLVERITGAGFVLWADMKHFAERQPDFPSIGFSQGAEILANEQFWIGLVIGAAFIYGAVYARKRLQEA